MVAFFTIAKKWKQHKCPSTDECINKMWHIHVIEYYLTLKMSEILIHVTTWVDFEHIMLRELRQTQKDKYCITPLI